MIKSGQLAVCSLALSFILSFKGSNRVNGGLLELLSCKTVWVLTTNSADRPDCLLNSAYLQIVHRSNRSLAKDRCLLSVSPPDEASISSCSQSDRYVIWIDNQRHCRMSRRQFQADQTKQWRRPVECRPADSAFFTLYVLYTARRKEALCSDLSGLGALRG